MHAHVRTVMNSHVITARPDDPLTDVARTVAAKGIGAVPVVDPSQRLVGIISTADLVNLMHDGEPLAGKRARDLMTAEPISIDEFAPAEEAIDLMRSARIHHLPVTRKGLLVGLVTGSDLLRYLVRSYLPPEIA